MKQKIKDFFSLLAIAIFLLSITTMGLTWVLAPFGIVVSLWVAFKMLAGLILLVTLLSAPTRQSK